MDMLKLAEYSAEVSAEGAYDFSGLNVTISPIPVLYPYLNLVSNTPYASSVIKGVVTELKDGANEIHTVVASVRFNESNEPDFAIWCGDTFIDGKLELSKASARINRIVSEGVWTTDVKQKLADEMQAQYATHELSARCGFWSMWGTEKKLCRHTAFFLKTLVAENPNFSQQLESHLESVLTGTKASATSVAASTSFGLAELAFRVPVLFEGDRGAGKTFAAREFAKAHHYPLIECAGHEGVEAIDLLGHLIPNESGGLVWKDGPLSEAFRLAQTERVVLVLDELLRVPVRQLSILLTILSPDDGVYRLRTGRVVSVEDGIAKEETLIAPVDNLCIVATTNVGAEYAVDDIDPALAERFIVIRKDSELKELQRILLLVAKKNHIAKSQVTQAISFYKKMLELYESGQIAQTPTTRTMVRALELARSNEEVATGLRAQVLLWVMRSSDGRPLEAQIKLVNALIKRIFG